MRARALALGLVLAGLTLASVGFGAARIDLRDTGGDGWTVLVLMESRLPRTLAVLLTGAALAVAGVVIQSLVRNRFVGPDTAGTGESAALGLLAVTLLTPAAPIWVKMVAASLSVMAGTALFLAIVHRLLVREMMLVPIAGLILSGIIGSVVTRSPPARDAAGPTATSSASAASRRRATCIRSGCATSASIPMTASTPRACRSSRDRPATA